MAHYSNSGFSYVRMSVGISLTLQMRNKNILHRVDVTNATQKEVKKEYQITKRNKTKQATFLSCVYSIPRQNSKSAYLWRVVMPLDHCSHFKLIWNFNSSPFLVRCATYTNHQFNLSVQKKSADKWWFHELIIHVNGIVAASSNRLVQREREQRTRVFRCILLAINCGFVVKRIHWHYKQITIWTNAPNSIESQWIADQMCTSTIPYGPRVFTVPVGISIHRHSKPFKTVWFCLSNLEQMAVCTLRLTLFANWKRWKKSHK